MHKIKDKALYVKIEKNRSEKILRRKRRIKKIKRKKNLQESPFNPFITQKIKGKYFVEMPQICSLKDNHSDFVDACNEIRKLAWSKDKIDSIDFDNIRELEPSAALLLAAEISHLKTRRKIEFLRPKPYGWDPEIKILLAQMGFFELFDCEPPKDNVSSKMNFLKFLSGKNATETNRTGELRERIEKRFNRNLTSRQRQALYEGLSEAITNTQNHAYGPAYPKNIDKWWLSAAYNPDENILTIMILDLGKTIPKTLPKKTWYEKISHTIALYGDGEAIKAAMKFSRTRTGKKHRGKGMSELLHFPKSIERFQSFLTIYSGKGKYVEITKGNKTVSQKSETLNKKLKGTLIEWRVSL